MAEAVWASTSNAKHLFDVVFTHFVHVDCMFRPGIPVLLALFEILNLLCPLLFICNMLFLLQLLLKLPVTLLLTLQRRTRP